MRERRVPVDPNAGPGKTSLALNNLRGFAIFIILAFHSSIAYVSSQPAAALPFDQPPYGWTINPIIDSNRWLGFDLFCAFQFLYMMQLMFFLSGLFVWPSLSRKGEKSFIYDRLLRLGVPFLLGAYVLMPIAYYSVYRETAIDQSWPAFWTHWLALPFWPAGPMWFLWQLLALNVAAVGLHRFAPRAIESLAALAAKATANRLFLALVGLSAAAFLGFALVFAPLQWIEFGPFTLQPLLLPQYAIFFLFGIVVGARGLEGGLLDANGTLPRRWPVWLVGAIASFAAWIASMALIFNGYAPPGLATAAGIAQVLFAATACFAAAAIFLRFAAVRSTVLNSVSENAYGIYLFHYVFVLWTQYLLLGVNLPAIAKGVIVFSVTLILSWAATAAMCTVPIGARLIRGQRRTTLATARSSAERQTR